VGDPRRTVPLPNPRDSAMRDQADGDTNWTIEFDEDDRVGGGITIKGTEQ
jgi:hypothetical protein